MDEFRRLMGRRRNVQAVIEYFSRLRIRGY
jgi:hypothetical protein